VFDELIFMMNYSLSSFLLDVAPINLLEKYIQSNLSSREKFYRSITETDPKLLEKIGKRKTMYIFKRAAKSIPHYRKFLSKRKIHPDEIRSFDDFIKKVPVTDSRRYIDTSKFLSDMCLKNHLCKAEILERSSGFTGKPHTWPRSHEEEEEAKKFFSFGIDLLYNTKKYNTLLINGFALGTWVSGVDIIKIVGDSCTSINPGLNEEEVLDIYQEYRKEFDQIILAGNPVFLKNIIEEGINKKIIKNEDRLSLLTGGESITEEFRDYLYRKINSSQKRNGDSSKGFIYSGFGASDIGIIGINENQDTVNIRRVARNNKALFRRLFGNSAVLPMLFQYDPTKYFIRQLKNKELEFTTCSLNVIMPLIKYNLHDTGNVYSYKEMLDILDECRIKITPKFKLPFVSVEGRSNQSIKFCSSFVYPENIINGICSVKRLNELTTGKFRMSIVHDKKQNETLLIEIQLKERKFPQKKVEQDYEKAIVSSLLKENKDLVQDIKSLEKKKTEAVKVKIFRFEEYPYKDSLKVRYI